MSKYLITIATLNVKGLNDRRKCQKTFTLLKGYKLDIILLQETNTNNDKNLNYIKKQYPYNSIWSTKTAILAGNRKVKFKETNMSSDGRTITTSTKYKQTYFQLTNIYAPLNLRERLIFFKN